MGLAEQLENDLKEAMRSGDTVRRSVIRLARNAIHNAEIAKQTKLDDVGIIEVLGREVKQRRESITEYTKAGRTDLADREKAEMAILQTYLPEQLSREQIIEEARKVVEEVGARGPSDMGKVMGRLMPLLRGRADGKEVSEVVSGLL